jgi:hypothetical protein
MKMKITGQTIRGYIDSLPEIFEGNLEDNPPKLVELCQAIPGVAHLYGVGFGGRKYLQVAVDEKGEIISVRKVPVLVPKNER